MSGVPISVALSGGGHRATLFSMGALLYLVDSRHAADIETVVSVSGGSITNGAVAQACDLRTVSIEDFDRVAAPVVSTIVRRGLILSALSTWVFFLLIGILVGLLGASAVVGWPVEMRWWVVTTVSVGIASLLFARGRLLEGLLAKAFFRSPRGPSLVRDINSTVEHVFAATDLNTGAPVYISSRDSGTLESPVLSTAPCGWMHLSAAVRASAAFPGGFPPKRLSFRRTGLHWRPRTAGLESFERPFRWFGRQRTTAPSEPSRTTRPPRSLFLSDGGVWNNLATDWHLGRKSAPQNSILLVIDASAPVGSKSLGTLHMPVLGELIGLSRMMTLLYANTVEPRVDALEAVAADALRLRAAGSDRWVLPVLARVIDGNAEIVKRHRRAARWAKADPKGYEFDDELRQLSRVWGWVYSNHHRRHGKDKPGLRVWNSTVPTTLGRIDRDTALSLLVHGYMATATALHIFADLKFPDSPRLDIRRFERLVSGETGTTPGFVDRSEQL